MKATARLERALTLSPAEIEAMGAGTKRVDLAKEALEAGASPSALINGDRPLNFAIARHDCELAKALIDAGADVNGPDGLAEPPLSKAGRYGDVAMIHLLLEHGADPCAQIEGWNQTVEQFVRFAGFDKNADAIAAWRTQELEKKLTVAWSDNAPTAPPTARARL